MKISKTIFSALLAASLASLSWTVHADDFIIATGGEGGGYEHAGKTISSEISKIANKKEIDFEAEVVNSAGTVENLEGLEAGQYQMVIAQADGLNLNPVPGTKAKGLYTETVLWIYNVKNGIKDLDDLEKKKKGYVMVLVAGSGAEVTMQSFVQEDEDYKIHYDNAYLADDNYEAADIVAEGTFNGKKVAGMLYVGKQIPNEIAEDFKHALGVGEATDSDFNDAKDVNGNTLYQKCTINKRGLKGLKSATTFSDLDTVCVKAMVVYSTEVEDKRLLKAISKGINKAKRKL